MGQNNRQRRAAKNRQRARNGHNNRTTPPRFAADAVGDEVLAAAAAALLNEVLRHLMRGQPPFDLPDFRRCSQQHQQAAVDGRFTVAVDYLIRAGWTPLDVHEVVRRKAAGSAVTHLLDVVAAATARYPVSLIHPQWQEQLDGLGAVPRRTGGVSPSFDWVDRSAQDWPSALEQLLAVLAVVCALPKLEPVLPAPGSRAEPRSDRHGIDGRVLRRVRGLLAKAESTEHAEEAEALMAKAQELMTRYSIERAVAESGGPAGPMPVSRRLWPESPYVHAKALLITAVATANNCRSVHSTGWGFVTIVGHAADLNVVELLTTSLLVQATRAMTQAGPRTTRAGTSRTRSYRQSFLVAYAERIGERLRESAQTTEASYDSGHGGELVPVLAARRAAVHDKVTALFPHSSSGASRCRTPTVGTPDAPPPIGRSSTCTTHSRPAPAEAQAPASGLPLGSSGHVAQGVLVPVRREAEPLSRRRQTIPAMLDHPAELRDLAAVERQLVKGGKPPVDPGQQVG